VRAVGRMCAFPKPTDSSVSDFTIIYGREMTSMWLLSVKASGTNNQVSFQALPMLTHSNSIFFFSDGNGSSYVCGRTTTVSWQGRYVNVRIVDLCPACGYNDLDLSPSAFEQLGDKSKHTR
jgi:hypothetical protein